MAVHYPSFFFSVRVLSIRVPPFWCLFYPRICVPSTEIQSLAGILQCTCLFSVRVLPFLVPLYPRPCVPSTKIQSMAGIVQCTCLFVVRMLPFWCSITHAHGVPSTDLVHGWYPAVHVFLFPSSGATFSGAPFFVLWVPLHQYFLPSALVTGGPRNNPYQGHLTLNHQSSITRCGLVYSLICCRCFE